MIAGKTLQATVSEHDWLTLVIDSGASKTFASHKSDSAELHPSSGLVMDGIAKGCSIQGQGICEFAVVAEDSTKITLRVQACFVPSLGSENPPSVSSRHQNNRWELWNWTPTMQHQ